MYQNPILTKTFDAAGAITKYRIAKMSTDIAVVVAAAATDKLIGVNGAITLASGDRGDVYTHGIVEVEYGGNVTRGDLLTSDSSGRAIAVTLALLNTGRCSILGRALVSGVVGDIGCVDLSIGESSMTKKIAGATMVVGSESSNTINVTIQLTDQNGDDLAVRASVLAYLSDDANGDSIAATAPDGGWAIGTDGLLIPVVASKAAQLVSESDGDIDVTITESGADTWYLIVLLPDGTLVASGAITFA